MGENVQIVVAVILLIGAYLLSRKVQVWRIRRAYAAVLKDLKEKGAVDAASAVALPYAKGRILNVGMRDFRPKAVEFLVMNDLVGRTEKGGFFLKRKGFTALEGLADEEGA